MNNLRSRKFNIFLAILIMLLSVSTPKLKTFYSYTEFARILETTALYDSELLNDNSNIICLLESSYFVEIISKYNDQCYFVCYNGMNGYVSKDKIKIVSQTPQNPYPNLNLKTFGNKCNLRRSPKANATVLVPIPANTEINFIGKVYGEAIMDYNGEIWYLVDYLGIKGYIYNGYISNIPIIYPNTEEIAFLENSDFITINPLSNESCIIIIVLILIPSLLILILLFKKPKPLKQKPKVIRNNDKIDYDSLL